MQLNKEKYCDLIIYILSKCYNKRNLGKTVLTGLLYFTDYLYYNVYGKLFTKETYIKSKKGIKPLHFKEITTELISKNILFLKKEDYYNRTIHRYYLTVLPTYNFNENEKLIINTVINSLSNNNALDIIKYANTYRNFKTTNFNEEINYQNRKL